MQATPLMIRQKAGRVAEFRTLVEASLAQKDFLNSSPGGFNFGDKLSPGGVLS